jgi:surfeit locus 1 family protein
VGARLQTLPPIDSGRPPRSPLPQAGAGARLVLLTLGAALLIAGFVALGIWQLHRLAWKRDLISRVGARVHAAPRPAPPPTHWPQVTAESDGYAHVTLSGRYLPAGDTLVQAVTERGAGFWVMTPLRTDAGYAVLINRGFVPTRNAVPPPPAGPVTVTGLLRITEPKGGFLRSNDPAADRWFSRDVAAIAARRQVGDAAPYFIDADAGRDPAALPAGGLTVIAFPNNHLQYALTWFGLAVLVAGGYAIAMREERKLRRAPRDAA